MDRSGTLLTCARSRAITLVACFMAMLLPARPVLAQMLPLIPEPIKTPELMKYGEIIGLSEQQRLALFEAHDVYKERYRQFEDRDVKKLQLQLLDVAGRFMRNRFAIPERAELESIMADFKRLLDDAQAIDRSFFDALAASITEDQVLRLQRARHARERAVYHDLIDELAGEMNPGVKVDFEDLLKAMEFSPQEKEHVDRIIAEHEAAMVSRARDVYIALEQAAVVVLDTIDRLNLRGMTPEQLMALAQDEKMEATLRGTFDEASKPFQQAAYQISQLNLRTFRKLKPLLSQENAADLRDRYYRRAYREAYDGRHEWQSLYAEALKQDGLQQEQVDALRGSLLSFVGQDDAVVEPVVADLEEYRKYRTARQIEDEEDDVAEVSQQTQELKEKRAAIDGNAERTLEAILGAEGLQKLKHAHTETAKLKEEDARATRAAAEVARRLADRHGDSDPMVVFTAPAISVAALNQVTSALQLDGDEQEAVRVTYEDYRAEYDALRSSPVETPDAADQGGPSPTSSQVKAHTDRFEQLRALDHAFFENVLLIIPGEARQQQIGWSRDVRDRLATLKAAQSVGWYFRANDEAAVDPVDVLLTLGLDEGAVKAVTPILQDYHAQTAPLVSQRLELAEDALRVSLNMKAIEKDGSSQARGMLNTRSGEIHQAAQNLNRQLRAVNRETLQRLLAAAPPDAAWQLRYAYNREAHPWVFSESDSMDRVLEAVLKLPDLQSQQRDTIAAISAEYRSAYMSICDRMIELREAQGERERDFDMPSREDLEQYNSMQRLRFDRAEVNARTKLRLRLALSESQRLAVPELSR